MNRVFLAQAVSATATLAPATCYAFEGLIYYFIDLLYFLVIVPASLLTTVLILRFAHFSPQRRSRAIRYVASTAAIVTSIPVSLPAFNAGIDWLYVYRVCKSDSFHREYVRWQDWRAPPKPQFTLQNSGYRELPGGEEGYMYGGVLISISSHRRMNRGYRLNSERLVDLRTGDTLLESRYLSRGMETECASHDQHRRLARQFLKLSGVQQ